MLPIISRVVNSLGCLIRQFAYQTLKLKVVLKEEPRGNEGSRIEDQKVHRLRDNAVTFLRRLLNIKLSIADDNRSYSEATNLL